MWDGGFIVSVLEEDWLRIEASKRKLVKREEMENTGTLGPTQYNAQCTCLTNILR